MLGSSQHRANKVHMEHTRACWMLQLEWKWPCWHLLCLWLQVPLFKLGASWAFMINLALNVRFVAVHASSLCSGYFLSRFWKKDNGPQTKNRHFCIYPPTKNIEFKFRLFPFVRAKSRFAPLFSGYCPRRTMEVTLRERRVVQKSKGTDILTHIQRHAIGVGS